MPQPNLQNEIKRSIPFEAPEEEAVLNMERTLEVLSADLDRFFRSYSVSSPQYNVLRILVGAGNGGLHSQDIGARMVCRSSDVTRLVDRLVKKGLAVRERCKEDRRVVWVRSTPAGQRLAQKLKEPVRAIAREQLDHLEAEELAELNSLLVKARNRP